MILKENTVAIIGYPNVGKSCLSNCLTRNSRASLVIDQPGITRDRLIGKCKWLNRWFWLVDTGGIEYKPKTSIAKQVQAQVDYSINTAEVVLLVLDNNDQIGNREQSLINRLIKTSVKLIFVISKCDNFNKKNLSYRSDLPSKYPLIYVSAVGGINIDKLITTIIDTIPLDSNPTLVSPPNEIKFALVGKTNAGKSSIAKLLTANSNRFIISSERNTTRDVLNERFSFDNHNFCLIDTPGLKLYRGQKWINNVLYYSYLRSIKAIIDADLVLLVVDITCELTRQHKKILDLVKAQKKLLILILNKTDLLSKVEINAKIEMVKHELEYLSWLKIITISAHHQGCARIIKNTMLDIWKRNNINLNRTIMNKFTQQLMENVQLPRSGKKRLKIHYIYHKKSRDVLNQFVVFVNDITLVTPTFRRFLNNAFYAGLAKYLKFLPFELLFMSKK